MESLGSSSELDYEPWPVGTLVRVKSEEKNTSIISYVEESDSYWCEFNRRGKLHRRSDLEFVDSPPRELPFKKGDKVNVFSGSQSTWVSGIVLDFSYVHDDDPTNELPFGSFLVSYDNSEKGKWIPYNGQLNKKIIRPILDLSGKIRNEFAEMRAAEHE